LIKFNALEPNAFRLDNKAIMAAQFKRNRRAATRRLILAKFAERTVSNESGTRPEVQSVEENTQTCDQGNEYDSEQTNEQVEHSLDSGICEAQPNHLDYAYTNR
jgi:hypothetical protein